MWKTIPNFENYEVSDIGEVRSIDRLDTYHWKGKNYTRPIKGKTLKQTVNKQNGYPHVHLGRSAIFPIHRLVAWAFIGPQAVGAVVRHKDGDKLNSRSDNLIYGTGVENYTDSIGHGTAHVGERHYNSVLTEEIVKDIRYRSLIGDKASEIARDLGFKYATILAVVNGKTWRSV